MARQVTLNRIHMSLCEDQRDTGLSLGYTFVRWVQNRVLSALLNSPKMSPGWPLSPGQLSCFSQSMRLVTAESKTGTRGPSFTLISPGPQCWAVELTALNRQALDSVQAITSKPSNVFCLALQALKSGAVVPFTSVKMLLCQRDTVHQTQRSTKQPRCSSLSSWGVTVAKAASICRRSHV